MTNNAIVLQKSRDDVFVLLKEHTKNESLIKHALAVEAAMVWYADHYQEDRHLWGATGLIHDFDYEENPAPAPGGHPYVGCEILRSQGYPPEMVEAIMGHAVYSGVPRNSLMSKVLFACDELTGLITAAVLVRPDRSIKSLEVKSVKKKMKDKAFARAVRREDIYLGVEELGVDLDVHIGNVIDAMRCAADELGLAGESA